MAGRARLRLLTLIEQGALSPEQVRPPLTREERAWITAGSTRLLAEALAAATERAVRTPADARAAGREGVPSDG
jgi:hypothetical protein